MSISADLPPIQGLWLGNRLGLIEQLSIRSFLAHGHPYHLYTYEDVADVPAGTEIMDGNEILPSSELYRCRGRGWAPFSDWFRWELLLRRGGYWMDLDMVCLRPLDFAEPVVLGLQSAGSVCAAAVKAPPRHPLAQALVEYCRKPGLSLRRRYYASDPIPLQPTHKYYWAAARGHFSWDLKSLVKMAAVAVLPLVLPVFSLLAGKKRVRSLLDGELAGPDVILPTIRKHQWGRELIPAIRPEATFYPVHSNNFEQLSATMVPGEEVLNLLAESYTLHIWAHKQKESGGSMDTFAPDSIIGRLLQRHGLANTAADDAVGGDSAAAASEGLPARN